MEINKGSKRSTGSSETSAGSSLATTAACTTRTATSQAAKTACTSWVQVRMALIKD